MLIRWATEADLPALHTLAADIGFDAGFITHTKSSIVTYEALTAVDYMSNMCMGFISFSREHNTIKWFAVAEEYLHKGAESRLLKTALRQLNSSSEVTYCKEFTNRTL